MTEQCARCDGPLVRFVVPTAVREHTDGTRVAAICANCLDVTDAAGDASDEPAFDRIDDHFPTGEGGAAFALLLGTLSSVAVRKDDALTFHEYAERRGVDVHLALDRLIAAADAGALDPAIDLGRRARQFESFVD